MRMPPVYVPFVLSSSSSDQWSATGRTTVWCHETRVSSMTMSLKGSRPTWYSRLGFITVGPASRTSSGAVGVTGRSPMPKF